MSVKFAGVPIKLGDRDFIVPPLSTGQMRTLQKDIEALGKSDSVATEQLLSTKLAHAALTRNYPKLKLEEFEELVDARNIRDLLGAVFGQSAVAPVGEIPAPPASANQSTGTSSTPA